jgi:hypothetical protein
MIAWVCCTLAIRGEKFAPGAAAQDIVWAVARAIVSRTSYHRASTVLGSGRVEMA